MTKVDWLYETCIACLKPFEETGERRRSDAHAIPESLGGTLSLACLCAGRNKLIGGRYEDKLPLVETYANEMERFADIVPFFAKQLRKPGRTSVAQSEHGPLKMKRDRSDGAFPVVDTELESGRFKGSGDAGREFRQRLRKNKASPTEIETLLARFEQGEAVQVDPVAVLLTAVPNWKVGEICMVGSGDQFRILAIDTEVHEETRRGGLR